MARFSRAVRGFAFLAGILPVAANAQSDAEQLAKELSNPISSLISVPFQYNYDSGMGATGEGSRNTVNFQPVVPISISENWNVISRTIVPFIDQSNVVAGTSQSGVGDIVQSFFFSPKVPTAGGLIWGAGPVFLLPTHSEVSGKQFAAGITGVVLKQTGPWTYGALANHLWSVGDTGGGGRKISATYLQPFLSYTTPDAWSFVVNSETTYDWENSESSVPINFLVTKVTKIGKQPVSIGGGVRYWASSTTNGPEDWGLRFQIVFLYPK